MKSPPRLAELVLRCVVPSDERDEVAEDLRELYRRRALADGERAARRWYVKQLVAFTWHAASWRRLCSRPTARPIRGDLVSDIRYALRGFSAARGFTVLVILTLALGIGVNLVMWSVVHQVLMKPLGYVNEDRIVRVWPQHHFTRRDYERFHTPAKSFDELSIYWHSDISLVGAAEPRIVNAAYVSYAHFRVFGVTPRLGRDFREEDHFPGAEPVAIVSESLWRSTLGGDNDVVGKQFEFGGHEGAKRTIVGVAPDGFRPLQANTDVWVPVVIDADNVNYADMASFAAVARLRGGVSPEQARAEIAALASTLQPEPSYLDQVSTYAVSPLRDTVVEKSETMLAVLAGAVGLVLLLCCVNVANLVLSRGLRRAREVSIRCALGASRSRIVRQLVTENVLLGGAAGLIGLAVANWFTSFIPSSLPRAHEIQLDGYTILFAIALSVITSLLFGVFPAFRTAGVDDALSGRSSTRNARQTRTQHALLVTELALALMLVISSGLLLKSFWQLQRVDDGLDGAPVVSMLVSPSPLAYPEPEHRRRFYREVMAAVDALPSIDASGVVQILPMTASGMAVGVSLTGEPTPDGVSPAVASYRIVSIRYRRALGIPLLAGRDLSEQDRADVAPVGLVNETLARELWPDGDWVGQTVHFENGEPWFTAVGVIGDVHQHRLEQPTTREVYIPFEQDSWPTSMHLVARSQTRDPLSVVPAIRAAVWSVDENVPISRVQSMNDVVSVSLGEHRFRTRLFSGFALVALVLSAIGVYGVVSYAVSQRTKDVGIRMALGATRGRVMGEIISESMKPVAIGLALGATGAFAAARALSTFLYEVAPHDMWVYSIVALLLATVAAVAAFVPAQRASHANPLDSLNIDG